MHFSKDSSECLVETMGTIEELRDSEERLVDIFHMSSLVCRNNSSGCYYRKTTGHRYS